MSSEPEEIIKEIKLRVDDLQRVCLELKGRTISMAPAVKVALAAFMQIEWVLWVRADRTAVWVCPWCRNRAKRERGEDQKVHAPDCERQVAIRVLEEALGK